MMCLSCGLYPHAVRRENCNSGVSELLDVASHCTMTGGNSKGGLW